MERCGRRTRGRHPRRPLPPRPSVFIETSVSGTEVLLEVAREGAAKCYLKVFTDEVYGSLGASGLFTEESLLAPSSPYSA
ncbi:MAG TPA: GDP-mannose 4,6-dehydratase [Anaeromyxobacter sp.]|nr:GDP-mannose 4,6-dehydratase [Anaeromyxobacter sp.]